MANFTHQTIIMDTPDLTEVQSFLTPQLIILNAFAFRHKNQHSHSHWFSTFNILRRRLRNLLALVSSSRPKHEKTLIYARHIQSLIPKTYITFSQLAADNQHAPLGVALLAVLAAITSSISKLLPKREEDGLTTESKQPALVVPPTAEADRGVSISRASLQPANKPMPKPASKPKKSSKSGDDPGKPKKKKKKAKDDELSRLFGSLA